MVRFQVCFLESVPIINLVTREWWWGGGGEGAMGIWKGAATFIGNK